jgi:hypothetical protein
MQILRQYSICDLQDEVRSLVDRGSLSRKHRIYELHKYFGDRDWQRIDRLLEADGYLLRDFVLDLVGQETWVND